MCDNASSFTKIKHQIQTNSWIETIRCLPEYVTKILGTETHGGQGWWRVNGETIPGSPLLTASLKLPAKLKLHMLVFEMDYGSSYQLAQALEGLNGMKPFEVDYFSQFKCIHRNTTNTSGSINIDLYTADSSVVFPQVIQTFADYDNSHGLVYIDPDNSKSHAFQYSTIPYNMNVLINVGASGEKRKAVKCMIPNRFPQRFLSIQHLKQYWFITPPKSQHHWVELFGTNNPNLNIQNISNEFVPIGSNEGESIMRRIVFPKKKSLPRNVDWWTYKSPETETAFLKLMNAFGR